MECAIFFVNIAVKAAVNMMYSCVCIRVYSVDVHVLHVHVPSIRLVCSLTPNRHTGMSFSEFRTKEVVCCLLFPRSLENCTIWNTKHNRNTMELPRRNFYSRFV